MGLFSRIREGVRKVTDWISEQIHKVAPGRPHQDGLTQVKEAREREIEREIEAPAEADLSLEDAVIEYEEALAEYEEAVEQYGDVEPSDYFDTTEAPRNQDNEAFNYIDEIVRIASRIKTQQIPDQQKTYLENRLYYLMDNVWELNMSQAVRDEVLSAQQLGEQAIDYLYGGAVFAEDVEEITEEEALEQGMKLRNMWTTMAQADAWMADLSSAASEYFVIAYTESGVAVYEIARGD